MAGLDRLRPVLRRVRSLPWVRAHPPRALKDLGDTRRNIVALTFDDGPDPRYTPAILTALSDAGMRATFFMCGANAERHPDLVREVAADGHLVAGHSWDHVPLVGRQGPGDPASRAPLDSDQLTRQIDQTHRLLRELSGQPVRLMRPPWGVHDRALRRYLRQRDLVPVLWTRDSRDWGGASAEEITTTTAAAAGGEIVLLHDACGDLILHSAPLLGGATQDRRPTVEAVPPTLQRLVQRGLTAAELPVTGPTARRGRRTSGPSTWPRLDPRPDRRP